MKALFFGLLLGLGVCPPVPAQVQSSATASMDAAADHAATRLAEYRRELASLRAEFGGAKELPDVAFFLFGMGSRPKLLYKSGTLADAVSGRLLRQWPIQSEIIVPPDYSVFITATNGQRIQLLEDEQGVWIEENGRREPVTGTQKPVRLPRFEGHSYPQVLRVLHQELLVNVIDGKPVPNYFVYPKPWYRDGAMMAMCFRATGNLDLIRDWVLGLAEPYDQNNAGETEADNLGQALFLISLASNRDHPLVSKILKELPRYEVKGSAGKFIRGRSDFAEHPVYQTKWAKFGLAALELDDPYVVPKLQDPYSALFWWAYKDSYVPGKDAHDRDSYPYLGWACDHFHGTKTSPISNRDYPLTWEQRASQARYEGMKLISEQYAQERLAAPHTWHAAEVFLYLLAQPAPAKRAAAPGANANGLRVYFVGNSVTDTVRYGSLVKLAASRGHPLVWGRQMIPGAPLQWLWDHPSDGFTEQPFGYPRQAFKDFQWNVVSLQPFDRGLASQDGSDDITKIRQYAELAAARSPEVQIYIYARWPRITSDGKGMNFDKNDYDPFRPGSGADLSKVDPFDRIWLGRYTGGFDTSNESRDYFDRLLVEARKVTPFLKRPLLLVPVGHAMHALDRRMRAGEVPGYTDIHQFYKDGIHLNETGSYLVGCTFFATLFREDPLGLPTEPYGAIAPAVAKAIQETVWRTVREHPESGVK